MKPFAVSAVVMTSLGLRHYLWLLLAHSADEAEGDAMHVAARTGELRSLIVRAVLA